MLQLVRTYREFREFLEAKKRKREPIRWRAKGVASASYTPSSARGFANFRRALIGCPDWGQASERIEALAHQLRDRHGCELPTPRKVMQNEDRSITLFWEGAMVRCLVDGYSARIGGVAGVPLPRLTTEFIDMLGFQARIQRAS